MQVLFKSFLQTFLKSRLHHVRFLENFTMLLEEISFQSTPGYVFLQFWSYCHQTLCGIRNYKVKILLSVICFLENSNKISTEYCWHWDCCVKMYPFCIVVVFTCFTFLYLIFFCWRVNLQRHMNGVYKQKHCYWNSSRKLNFPTGKLKLFCIFLIQLQ